MFGEDHPGPDWSSGCTSVYSTEALLRLPPPPAALSASPDKSAGARGTSRGLVLTPSSVLRRWCRRSLQGPAAADRKPKPREIALSPRPLPGPTSGPRRALELAGSALLRFPLVAADR